MNDFDKAPPFTHEKNITVGKAHVIDGIQVTPKVALDDLRMRELASIEAFAKGRATLQDWQDINGMLTISETMALAGVGPEALVDCEAAQKALIEAARRFEATGRMGTTGPGLQAFRSLFEVHDLQRQSVQRSDYEKLIQKSLNRVRSKSKLVVEL